MRLAKLTVLVLTLGLALTGCTPESPPIVPTSIPTVKPVFASNEEALAAAKVAYEKYFAVSEEILGDGGKNPDRLRALVTSAVYQLELPGFEDQMSKGWRNTGRVTIDPMVLESYFPDAPMGVDVVTVYACVDASKVDVLNSDGHSVVSPDRPDTSTFEVSFDLSMRRPTSLILSRQKPWTGTSICTP